MSAETRLVLDNWRSHFKRLPPLDVDGRCGIVERLRSHIDAEQRLATPEEKDALLEMVEDVEDCMEEMQKLAQGQCPLAFVIPSLEQAMVLNAWAPHAREAFDGVRHREFDNYEGGYRTVANLSSNRNGKTFSACANTVLWIVPNDPGWRMFDWMDDWKGRGRYRILPRPDWERWKKRGRLIYPGNDAPPKGACEIWHGVGRDDDWTHKVWLAYKRLMAPSWFGRRTDGGQAIFKQEKRFETAWGHAVTGMSTSAESEKWSGKACWLLNIDEGIGQEHLDEGITRIQAGGYANWAYTPVDPANIGEKTRVAKNCYTKPKENPLVGKAKFFIHFSLEDAPPWIIPDEKKQDDIRRFKAMGDKGKPRLHGGFFDSSPSVFSNFDETRNVLPWTGSEIRKKFPNGMIIRGMDEGLANPTACIWALVTPTNDWIFFQEWEQSGLSVTERCERIIELSGNNRVVKVWKEEEQLRTYREEQAEGGMIIRRTFGDSKMFKRNPEKPEDDWTETYRKAGLPLERASNIPPKSRCDFLNDMFLPEPNRNHILRGDPQYGHLPQASGSGSRAYVSRDCTKLVERFINYLWQQLASGPNKGGFTDNPETKDDHSIDGACFCVCSKLKWIDMQVIAQRRGQASQMVAPRGNPVTGYA